MTRFTGRLVCILLAIVMLSSTIVLGAEDPYVKSFEDPQDYPENPDADLKSMTSCLEGDFVVIVITTYGSISDEPGYYYSIFNNFAYDNPTWFSFYLTEGSGTFDYYDQDQSVQLKDIWEIVNNTLIVKIPVIYTGPQDSFNLTASTSYMAPEGMDFLTDYINMVDTPYIDNSYNFDEAEPLGVPESIRDSLDDGEGRIYSLNLSAGTGVLIVLNGSLGDWPYFTILDSERNYITSSMSVGRNCQMTFIPQETEIYFVAIERWSVTGNYRITSSLRGGSGEGYERATPNTIPWHAGDEWSAGGYISMEEMLDQMLDEAGISGMMYTMMFPELRTEGGLGDFLIVTYTGEENGQYRFDFKCRLYCDMMLNMTTVTSSESYMDEVQTSEATSTMYMNTSGIVDVSYTGSVWLGYYENADGNAYYGVEKESVSLTGSLDIFMEMADSTTYAGMEDISYRSETRMRGDIALELLTQNTPGIPYLPAQDEILNVDKKASTRYEGSIDVNMWTCSEYSGMDEYPSMEPEDMNETMDSDFDESYIGYYMLEYDPDTQVAEMVPLITDPFMFLMLGITQSYGYDDNETVEILYPYWLDYGTSKATYDSETGFYTSFELPLSPLSNSAMSLDESGSESSAIGTFGMLGLITNLALGDVSQNDAKAFFEDPAGFISAKEDGEAGQATLVIAGVSILFGAAVLILVIADRRMRKRQ